MKFAIAIIHDYERLFLTKLYLSRLLYFLKLHITFASHAQDGVVINEV